MSSKTVFGLIGVTFLLMCVLYVYLSGQVLGGHRGRAGDADRRASSSRPFGLPGRRDRLVEQSDLRTDAFDAGHRGAADGFDGRLGDERRAGGAGGGGRGLRLLGGRRRAAPGLQSRLHPRRHAAHHSDRRADRRGGGQPARCTSRCCVLHSGQHQRGRHRVRRSPASGAASRTDGVDLRRASSAATWPGRWWSPAWRWASR